MSRSILLLVLAGLAGCGGSAAPPPIFLGHVATTSGPAGALGEQEVLGIRLAVEELGREKSEALGGRAIMVRHSDPRGQIDAFEGQAVRLVTVSRALALVGGNTAEEVQRLEQSRVPLLTPLGYKPRGTGELVFSIGMTPALQAEALARFAVEEKSVKTWLFFVDERSEGARILAEEFERALHKSFQDKFPKETYQKPETVRFGKDPKWSELVARLAPGQVQAAFFAGSATDFQEWSKAMNPTDALIFYGSEHGVARQREMHNAIFASPFAVDKELPRSVAFAQKFREAFKDEPDAHAALAYEGVHLLVGAMRRAQVPFGERMLEELRKTKDFQSLTGPISFGPDQQVRRPVFVGQREGNGFKVLKRYDPKTP